MQIQILEIKSSTNQKRRVLQLQLECTSAVLQIAVHNSGLVAIVKYIRFLSSQKLKIWMPIQRKAGDAFATNQDLLKVYKAEILNSMPVLLVSLTHLMKNHVSSRPV